MRADIVIIDGGWHRLFPIVLFRVKIGAIDNRFGGAMSLFKYRNVLHFGAQVAF